MNIPLDNFTVERLEDLIEYENFGSLSMVQLSDLSKIALAAKFNQKLNYPEIPEGWVLVPKEPTEDMVIQGFESSPEDDDEDFEAMSGCQQAAYCAELCWAAMLAAAPKPDHIGEASGKVADGWIKCSDRMPPVNEAVLTWDGIFRKLNYTTFGQWQSWQQEKITHWMPLPTAPKPE